MGNDAAQMRGRFSGEQLMGCAPPLGPGVCVSCDNGELIVRQHHQAFLRRGCRICIQKVMQSPKMAKGKRALTLGRGVARQDKRYTIKPALVECDE